MGKFGVVTFVLPDATYYPSAIQIHQIDPLETSVLFWKTLERLWLMKILHQRQTRFFHQVKIMMELYKYQFMKI
eukprot:UN03423